MTTSEDKAREDFESLWYWISEANHSIDISLRNFNASLQSKHGPFHNFLVQRRDIATYLDSLKNTKTSKVLEKCQQFILENSLRNAAVVKTSSYSILWENAAVDIAKYENLDEQKQSAIQYDTETYRASQKVLSSAEAKLGELQTHSQNQQKFRNYLYNYIEDATFSVEEVRSHSDDSDSATIRKKVEILEEKIKLAKLAITMLEQVSQEALKKREILSKDLFDLNSAIIYSREALTRVKLSMDSLWFNAPIVARHTNTDADCLRVRIYKNMHENLELTLLSSRSRVAELAAYRSTFLSVGPPAIEIVDEFANKLAIENQKVHEVTTKLVTLVGDVPRNGYQSLEFSPLQHDVHLRISTRLLVFRAKFNQNSWLSKKISRVKITTKAAACGSRSNMMRYTRHARDIVWMK